MNRCMNKRTNKKTRSPKKKKTNNLDYSFYLNRFKKTFQKRFKRMSNQEMIGILFLVLLLIGGFSAMILLRSNVDTRNQAWIPADPYGCPANPCGDGKVCVAGTCKLVPTITPTNTISPTTPVPTIPGDGGDVVGTCGPGAPGWVKTSNDGETLNGHCGDHFVKSNQSFF